MRAAAGAAARAPRARGRYQVIALSERQRQTLIWSAVAVLLTLALLALGPVLTPFVAALILGYVLQPGVDGLVRRRVPRPLAAVLIMVLALLVALSLALIVVPIVQKELQQIRVQLPGLMAQLSDAIAPRIRDWFGVEGGFDRAAVREWFSGQLAAGGTDLASLLLGYVQSGWSAALEVLGLVFLVPIVLFYLLLDWPSLRQRLWELIPPRWQPTFADWTGEIDTLLSQYLRAQLLVMLALATYFCLVLALAGFQLWLPIGLLSGLLIFIPYLGFALGFVFALFAGLLQFGLVKGALLVAVIYMVAQAIESFYLTPKLVGERIGLHPLAVILALLAFGYMFGFVGVLLALPLAATLAVALRRLRAAYVTSSFFRREQ
ncbi:MAG: AI-2E family transporter [Burkholderiales bacterium]|nr:MAG: AI-2E family transporter [Burkholderiales bacterium]